VVETHSAPKAADDEPLFTVSMYGTAADADKAREEWLAAKGEPQWQAEQERGGQMSDHKRLAVQALQNMRGDDLARARWTFKRYTPAQMQEEYGASGRTCAQVLAEYEASDARIDAAIKWVEAQPC
jgi:hypothetical protein